MIKRSARFGRVTAITAAALSLVLALSSCGAVPDSSSNANDANQTSSAKPVRGGTLTYGTKSEPGNGGLDPFQATVYSSTAILNQIYEPLIVKDDNGKFQPSLATEWKQVNDTTFDFTLRKNVKFADGSDLTASDVIWTFEYAKKKSPQSKVSLLNNLKDIKDLGNGKIEFTFSKPNPAFLNGISDRTYGFYIVDQQWYEKSSETERQKTSNGTGPFQLKEWNKGKNVELTRNKHYWEKGKPYLDGINFVTAADENALLALVQQGQADMAWFWQPELAYQAKDAGNVLGDLQKTSTRFLFIDPNHGSGALNDLKVRQALSKAIDRDQIIKLGAKNRGAKSFATPPAFSDIAKPTNDTPNTKYDPEGAKKLLAESDHPKPTISLAYDATTADAPVLELIKDQASKVGITIELKPVPYEEIQAVFTNGDDYVADIILVQDVISADPASSFSWWLETGSNVDRWGNSQQAAKAKALLADIQSEPDANKRLQEINDLNNEISEQVLTITPFATPLNYQVWTPKVKGYQTDPADSRWHLKDTWLAK